MADPSPEARDIMAVLRMRFWTVANLWRTGALDRDLALELQRQLAVLLEYVAAGLHHGAAAIEAHLLGQDRNPPA
jgi:hypothetical protein